MDTGQFQEGRSLCPQRPPLAAALILESRLQGKTLQPTMSVWLGMQIPLGEGAAGTSR